jgi:hypothetical protein
MSSHRIYELVMRDDAIDKVIELLRTSLSGSASEEDLFEEYLHSSEPASHGLREGISGGDPMVGFGTRQEQGLSEMTARMDDLQFRNPATTDGEQDYQVDAMRGITHKSGRSTGGPSAFATADPLIHAQTASEIFEVGGDYDSLLCRVGGVSKVYHRLMVPGPGHYHAEYNRQRTQDEPEVVEDFRDDAFLTGVPSVPIATAGAASSLSAAQANAQTEVAEGLRLLIDLQLGDIYNTAETDAEE